MMEHPIRVGNRLLAALPPADFGLLAPYLQKVSLEQDAVLLRSGDRIEQVYFPHSGAISFMLDMPNGQTVATAVIGHEGALRLSRYGGRTRGRDRLADFRISISCSLQPEWRHQTCGADPREGAADAVPACGRLQCAAPRRSPHGPVVAPHPRSN